MTSQLSAELVDTGAASIEVHAGGVGPLIVLLPSLGRGADDFRQLTTALIGRGYRVLCPEPRGIGRSKGPMTGNTLHDLAADVAFIITRETSAPCIVAGHAFGQKVARTLAADHPALVRAVIMLAGAGRAPIPEHVRLAILGCGDYSKSDEERIACLKIAFFAPGNDPTVWLSGWRPETKAMELEAERATPPDEFIGAGRALILDVQAEDDTVVPLQHRQDLKNELGDRVTIAVIANAGHALLPEQPVALAEAVDTYIRGLARGAGVASVRDRR
jgi:pimeloyl-ACP methyl ester carboxylesterase